MVRRHYQKAGEIDFTTRCLALLFGESWAFARGRGFGQRRLRSGAEMFMQVAVAAGVQEFVGVR